MYFKLLVVVFILLQNGSYIINFSLKVEKHVRLYYFTQYLTTDLTEGPVFVRVPEPFQPFQKDESVTIEVVVEAVPKPTINWICNGKELTAKDGVQINKDVTTNTYTLIIPKLNPSVHAGTITVKAFNVISSVEHVLKLEIQG